MKQMLVAIGLVVLVFAAMAFCAPRHFSGGVFHHYENTDCGGHHGHGCPGNQHCR